MIITHVFGLGRTPLPRHTEERHAAFPLPLQYSGFLFLFESPNRNSGSLTPHDAVRCDDFSPLPPSSSHKSPTRSVQHRATTKTLFSIQRSIQLLVACRFEFTLTRLFRFSDHLLRTDRSIMCDLYAYMFTFPIVSAKEQRVNSSAMPTGRLAPIESISLAQKSNAVNHARTSFFATSTARGFVYRRYVTSEQFRKCSPQTDVGIALKSTARVAALLRHKASNRT